MRRHKALNEAGIDEIERSSGKVKRLQCIHHEKLDIFKFLGFCQSTSVLDHALTNVYSDYVDMGIPICYLKRPAARATGDIEDTMHILDISLLSQESPHAFGEVTFLMEQTS